MRVGDLLQDLHKLELKLSIAVQVHKMSRDPTVQFRPSLCRSFSISSITLDQPTFSRHPQDSERLLSFLVSTRWPTMTMNSGLLQADAEERGVVLRLHECDEICYETMDCVTFSTH